MYTLHLSNIFFFTFIVIFLNLFREGDATSLRVNAIVHPTNESLTEKSQLSLQLMDCAGPKLKEELVMKVKCKSRNQT